MKTPIFYLSISPNPPKFQRVEFHRNNTKTTMTMLLARPTATAAARSTVARRMSTVAASTVSSDVPSYVSEAPAATVSTLGNGVTVASLYNADG